LKDFSIKHVRSRGPQVKLESFGVWEHVTGRFRFISHGIEAKWEDGSTIDAVACLLGHVSSLNQKLEANLPDLKIRESAYGFYDWAFTYHVPMISAGTLSTRIKMWEKTEGGSYNSVDPPDVRFVVLADDLIGHRPETHFPQV
jgi:hypothetical protein